MKSELKERRNKAIRKRISELCGTGMKTMDIYSKVAAEFWLDESTLAHIASKCGYYANDL